MKAQVQVSICRMQLDVMMNICIVRSNAILFSVNVNEFRSEIFDVLRKNLGPSVIAAIYVRHFCAPESCQFLSCS